MLCDIFAQLRSSIVAMAATRRLCVSSRRSTPTTTTKMNKLEQAQFVILVRTPSFIDSRSPFVDISAVAHQRELRKLRQQKQNERDRASKQQRDLERGVVGAAAVGSQQRLNGGALPSSSSPATATTAVASASSGGVDDDDDDDEDGDDDGGGIDAAPRVKKTTQQLLSPAALFGNCCIVTGVSRVCEHILRLYENEVMAERARKAVEAREKQRRQHEADEAQRKRQREKEEEQRRRRAEMAERAVAQMQEQAAELQRQQEAAAAAAAAIAAASGAQDGSASPTRSVSTMGAPEASTSAFSKTPTAAAAEQQRQQQQQQQQDAAAAAAAAERARKMKADEDARRLASERKKAAEEKEAEEAAARQQAAAAMAMADPDAQFVSETSDLSTTFPLAGVPPHFQYDGGIFFKFLDSLPLCAVFELSEQDGKTAASEEPHYIPHGMPWIKAQLLLWMEARAKAIEAPSE